MNEWSFFLNGVCTGVSFFGTEETMMLNLPAGQVAHLGHFEFGATEPNNG